MEASNDVLAMLLTLAGLTAATTEYSHLLRRRAAIRRVSVVDPRTLYASGLFGLVRVFIVES